ncbi:MAG: hypothetical protein NTW28_02525 [Candidatus Solibacter sp.]|nr:hypothetical protein [Candidatus Solibacter sp.]
MQRLSILSAVVTLLLPTTGTAYMRGYLPLTQSEISKRFPVRVLRAIFTPWEGGAARVGTTTVRFVESDNLIQFSGIDRAQKTWTVSASAMMGGALYSADLDKNGTIDLIYAAHTGGNGLAPPMHVLSLMFDETGRPVPCEMDGYFEIDGRGLLDMIDLDGDEEQNSSAKPTTTATGSLRRMKPEMPTGTSSVENTPPEPSRSIPALRTAPIGCRLLRLPADTR